MKPKDLKDKDWIYFPNLGAYQIVYCENNTYCWKHPNERLNFDEPRFNSWNIELDPYAKATNCFSYLLNKYYKTK